MPAGNVRTSDYDQADRKRLGDAVADARRAAGHRHRPSFCAATGLKKRSLEAVELGEAGVGVGVLQDVGRALGRFHPTWNADTPRQILEGAPAPDLATEPKVDTTEIAAPDYGTSGERPEIGSDEWLMHLADALEDEEYFRDVRLLWVRYAGALNRIEELERMLTERPVPQR